MRCLPLRRNCLLCALLSSLASKDLEGNDGSGIYNYYLHVCGPLTSQPSCTTIDPKTSTCQVQVNPAGASYDTGNWGTQQWAFIDGQPSKGVMYTLTGSPKCWNMGAFIAYTANVMVSTRINAVQLIDVGCQRTSEQADCRRIAVQRGGRLVRESNRDGSMSADRAIACPRQQ